MIPNLYLRNSGFTKNPFWTAWLLRVPATIWRWKIIKMAILFFNESNGSSVGKSLFFQVPLWFVSRRQLLNFHEILRPKQRSQRLQIGSQGVRTGPEQKINELYLISGKNTTFSRILLQPRESQLLWVRNVYKCQRNMREHPWICLENDAWKK